ncbi:MAG: hypothetical protein J6U51_07835 [Bacteroidales bacterium]|nr:hypothetical protein [Bacteroidales bacterium]
MKKNKFIAIGDVSIRISNTERRNTSNPRHCFCLSILDYDKKVLYRKDVVVHCSFDDTNTDEDLYCVIERITREIRTMVPQTKGEKERFNVYVKKLTDKLYEYSEITKPVITLF